MSNVLEQFHAAQAAVNAANTALAQLGSLIGQAHTGGNGTQATNLNGETISPKAPVWLRDPVKKARAIKRFRKTMRARARLRQQQHTPDETTTA